MDPSPVIKLPTFTNTRNELASVVAERKKLETELKELEAHLHTFEDSILKRGGPYFGHIGKGERAEHLIEEINKSAVGKDDGSISSAESGKEEVKVKESQRLFSNSSVTSPAYLNKITTQTPKPLNHSSYAKLP